jgi:hypothetical protein
MPNALKDIPDGWEVVPVGKEITADCMFCAHPFTSWEPMVCEPFLYSGICQSENSPSLPHGHYIRRIA